MPINYRNVYHLLHKAAYLHWCLRSCCYKTKLKVNKQRKANPATQRRQQYCKSLTTKCTPGCYSKYLKIRI